MYIGINTAISVNGSDEGVITAAATSIATIACRRYVWKNSLVSIPIRDRNSATSGSSKTIPIINISIRKLSI